MKMKIFKTLILSSVLAASAQASKLKPSKVNLNKSQVTWTGSKVVGSTHTGNIKIKSAEIPFKNNEPASAKIVIDMTTITNTDLTDKKWNKKLVGHLNSKDFFSVDKFKTAEFASESIQKASDKFYLLKGKLNIKGKALPIKVKAEVTENKGAYQVVKADFTFDRTKYDIKYGSGSFFTGLGDKMISDEVKMSVVIHLKK